MHDGEELKRGGVRSHPPAARAQNQAVRRVRMHGRIGGRRVRAGGALATLLLVVASNWVSCTDESTDRTASGLRRWLLERDGSRSAPPTGVLLNVGVQHYEQGRGLSATKALRRGEVAAWVPEHFALSTETTSLPAQVLNRFLPRPQYGPRTVQLAAILLFESSLGQSSEFYQHIKSLPAHTPGNSATWSRSQKTLFNSVTGMQGSDCEAHLPLFVHNLLKSADEHQQQLALELQTPVALWSSWNSSELQVRSQWACAMAISRNFGGSLYPMLDMANHNPRAVWGEDIVSIDFSPSCVPKMLECFPARAGVLSRSKGPLVPPLRCVESVRKSCLTNSDSLDGVGQGFVALRDFEAGEQILDNYGMQSNLKLLFQWGFVDEGNLGGSDAILDWRTVSYLWEEHHHQWAWMSRSVTPAIAQCVKLFDRLSLVRAGTSTLPELRLSLNQTAPHGFNAPAIDCIRILAQNFASEAELTHELARGSLYRWPLEPPHRAETEAVVSEPGERHTAAVPECGDSSAGPRAQADCKVLEMVLAACTEIADRLESAAASPAYARVHEQVLQGVEHPAASLHTSKQIIRWIEMENHAAKACAREISERMREGAQVDAHERCARPNGRKQ